jgi:flagellar M-ring protein FliF
MRFAADTVEPPPAAATLLGLPIERDDLVRLAETAVIGIVALLGLLFVLRPMVARLTTLPDNMALAGGGALAFLGGPGAPALAGAVPGAAMALPGTVPGATAGTPGATAAQGGPVSIGGGGPSVPLLEDESMVQVAQFEGQMRASSLRRISTLVERHPEESLSVLRGWLAQDGG